MYRITKWLRVEGTYGGHPVQGPAQTRTPRAGCPGLCPDGLWSSPGRKTQKNSFEQRQKSDISIFPCQIFLQDCHLPPAVPIHVLALTLLFSTEKTVVVWKLVASKLNNSLWWVHKTLLCRALLQHSTYSLAKAGVVAWPPISVMGKCKDAKTQRKEQVGTKCCWREQS